MFLSNMISFSVEMSCSCIAERTHSTDDIIKDFCDSMESPEVPAAQQPQVQSEAIYTSIYSLIHSIIVGCEY